MDSCEIEWVKSQVATKGRNYAKSESKVAYQGRTLLGAWMGRGGMCREKQNIPSTE